MSMKWSKIQNKLENMYSDCLIILEACNAAGAVTESDPMIAKTRTKLIAACGYDNITPSPSRKELFGFENHVTSSRMLEMTLASNFSEKFTAASLHCDLVKAIMENNFRKEGNTNILPAPVYLSVGTDFAKGSIPLSALEPSAPTFSCITCRDQESDSEDNY